MLPNLNELIKPISEKINKFNVLDCSLPVSFTSVVKQINRNTVEYGNSASCITNRNGQHIFLSNNWFYIAAILAPLYDPFYQYKKLINKIVDKETLRQSNSARIKFAVNNRSDLSSQDKEYLLKFALEPLWWNGGNSNTGGKTLDRGDALASAILSIANLVNDSQAYVVKLWEFFGENPNYANILNIESDIILSQAHDVESIFSQIHPKDEHNHIIIDITDDGYNCTSIDDLEEIIKANSSEISRFFHGGADSSSFAYLKYFKLFEALSINNKQAAEAVLKSTGLYPLSGSGSGVSSILNILNTLTKNPVCGVRIYQTKSIGQQVHMHRINDNDCGTGIIESIQKIYYGSPGTGKSFEVRRMLKSKNIPDENIFRTTFHPDSDYSSFVGAYKPLKKDGSITYDFEPQAFIKAYVKAWQNQEEQVYLVIEEINRGNCAQIFGDLFQLLDRKDGVSEYPVNADAALAKYLNDTLEGDASEGILNGKLKLPANLNIIATMNTSDQSLFPMDSAFKRRWDWVYIPTTPPADKERNMTLHIGENYKDFDGKTIAVGDYEYKWTKFLKAINKRISAVTHSDDKQLGFWFVKTDEEHDEISVSTFVSKVIFYLWNDVFKDMGPKGDNPFTVKVDGKNEVMTFNAFFDVNSEGKIVENIGVLHTFMCNLGLDPNLNKEVETAQKAADMQNE